MKKLSKLSLLGEIDLLSKAELRQLIGSGDGGCPSKQEECKGQSCQCGANNGNCTWAGGACRCLNHDFPYGGIAGYGYY